jgi:hypothetical protein
MLLIQYNLLFLLIKYFFHCQLIEQNLNIVVQSFVVFDQSHFRQVQNLYHMYLKKTNLLMDNFNRSIHLLIDINYEILFYILTNVL